MANSRRDRCLAAVRRTIASVATSGASGHEVCGRGIWYNASAGQEPVSSFRE